MEMQSHENSIPSHCDRFFENMIENSNFIYDLTMRLKRKGHDIVDPEIINFGTQILRAYDKKELLEGFITHSEEHWDKILNVDESFITENAFSIFSALPTQHVSAFKEIFEKKNPDGSPVVDQSDRDIIWRFFKSYVRIAIKFIHDERKPYCLDNECRYAIKYMQDIDIQKHAKKWDIKLPFPRKV